MVNAKGLFSILFLGVFLSLPSQIQTNDNSPSFRVNCNQGQTITSALQRAIAGSIIRVTGTCIETIVIATDGLILIGEEGATIDGGDGSQDVVTIDGARDLTIRGFTIQNGREGILAIHDATFTVTDTTVQDNRSHGIELVRASAEFTSVNSQRNGRAGLIIARTSSIDVTDVTLQQNLTGLVVFSNSSVRLFGTNLMNQNATQGWTVGLGGAAFSIGSDIQANDNGAEGVFILQAGNIQLVGGALEASRNQTDGIRLRQNASILMGIEEFGVPGTVVTNDNVGHGISAAAGSDVAGIQIMPLTSQDNGGAGLRLDDGSSATLSGATIGDNGTADVELTFGSRATLVENNIGSIACDETALLRGDIASTCPTSSPSASTGAALAEGPVAQPDWGVYLPAITVD